MPPKPHSKSRRPTKNKHNGDSPKTIVPQPIGYKGRTAKNAPEVFFQNGHTRSATETCIHNSGKTGLKVGG